MSWGHPYAGTAWYYAEYRAYPSDGLLDALTSSLGWTAAHRVLDLGSGPGQIARRLAPRVAQVVAIDIEADMVAEGERRAAEEGIGNIRFVRASADDLASLAFGPHSFRGVTIGSAFHWFTDRDRVLRDLGQIVDGREGAVALVSNGWDVGADEPLERAEAELRALLGDHLAASAEGPHPRGRHDPFRDILGRSPFPVFEHVQDLYEERFVLTLDALIGHEYSMSHVLARLGAAGRGAFEDEARRRLAWVDDVGEVSRWRRGEALIGRRA